MGALYVKDISIVGFATTYATESEIRACADRINALAASGRASTPENEQVIVLGPTNRGQGRRRHEYWLARVAR